MKVILTFSKQGYAVADDEAANIEVAMVRGGFVKLRSGHLLNVSAIESIGPAPKIRYYNGRPVLRGDKTMNAYGNAVQIEHPEDIYLDEDPKWQGLLDEQTKKLE